MTERDWQRDLNNIFRKADDMFEMKTNAPTNPKPEKKSQHLYHIRKRSLPVSIDVPIVMYVTRDDAEKWIRKLKPKIISHDCGTRIVYYYDVVRADGYKSGVYDNNVKLTKPEGSDDDKEIDLLKDLPESDVNWAG